MDFKTTINFHLAGTNLIRQFRHLHNPTTTMRQIRAGYKTHQTCLCVGIPFKRLHALRASAGDVNSIGNYVFVHLQGKDSHRLLSYLVLEFSV